MEKKKQRLMDVKDFIEKYIFPSESKETIIGYLQGDSDFDHDYLQEVAEYNNIKLKEDE